MPATARLRGGFDCGVEVLNRHLKDLATQHRARGIATTFVLIDTDQPTRILGYYTLRAGSSISHWASGDSIARALRREGRYRCQRSIERQGVEPGTQRQHLGPGFFLRAFEIQDQL